MSALTIGRIGLDTSAGGDGVELEEPTGAARSGREVTLTGQVKPDSTDVLAWRVAQFYGLRDGDDDVIPVTSAAYPGFGGYYRVLGVSIGHGKVAEGGWFEWGLQLEAVLHHRRPRIDIPTGYGLLPNGHSITTFDAVVAIPGAAVDASSPFPSTGSTSRAVSDGSAVVVLADTEVTTTGATGTGRLVIDAGDYYHGGCRVEHDIDGNGTWMQAVGRADFPAPGEIRITNGLVRATITYGTAGTSQLTVEWWDTSAWTTPVEFYLSGVGTHDELVYYAGTVIRNTAEQVSVKFSTVASSFSAGMADVTFTVRRGSRWVSCYTESLNAPATGWELGFSTSTGCADITGGLRRLLADGEGHRQLIAGQYATTKDTSDGTVRTVSITAALFGIGCEIDGSSATGQNTAANQMQEWYGAVSERAVVVAG